MICYIVHIFIKVPLKRNVTTNTVVMSNVVMTKQRVYAVESSRRIVSRRRSTLEVVDESIEQYTAGGFARIGISGNVLMAICKLSQPFEVQFKIFPISVNSNVFSLLLRYPVFPLSLMLIKTP